MQFAPITLALSATLSTAALLSAAHAQEPASPQQTPPAAVIEGTAVAARDTEASRVDRFLDELEKSGATLETLSGTLSLEKFDAFTEQIERRFGRVVLDRKDGNRRFSILFDEFIDGDGRSDRSRDHWIYADGWLCEKDDRNKSFTKRQIARPNEKFDPLAIGEGPIPLPIGQRKADVLARFDVRETEVPIDLPLLSSMQNVAGLKLTPKEGTPMAKETLALELFYDRTSLAPTGVVIREKNGNRTIARITNPVVNGAVKDEDRALLEIPAPDPKEWTIDVKPLAKSDA